MRYTKIEREKGIERDRQNSVIVKGISDACSL